MALSMRLRDTARLLREKHTFELAASFCFLSLLLLGVSAGWFENEKKVSVVVALLTFGSLTFAAAGLLGKERFDRAAFLKEHATKFFTDRELMDAWFELVEQYDNAIYLAIDQAVVRHGYGRPLPQSCVDELHYRQRVWNAGAGRDPRKRFWHPETLPRSPEERRIDSLMGYFDVLAYYWQIGYASLEEMHGLLGTYLGLLNAKRATRDYVRNMQSRWDAHGFNRLVSHAPFEHLCKLLEAYEREYQKDLPQSLEAPVLTPSPQVYREAWQRIEAQPSTPKSPAEINQGKTCLCAAACLAWAGLKVQTSSAAASRFEEDLGRARDFRLVRAAFDQLGWGQSLCNAKLAMNDETPDDQRSARVARDFQLHT